MIPMQRVELLKAACCVAGADGETTDRELELLERLASDVGVGTASFTAMMERAKSDTSFCQAQFKYLQDNQVDCMAVLLQVAIADGSISTDEQEVLRHLAKNLKIPSDVFNELVQQANEVASNQDSGP